MNAVEPIRDFFILDSVIRDLEETPTYHALFNVGIYSGFRISDMLPMRVRVVRADEFKIRQKKNKSWVTLPVHPDLKKSISDYIADKDDDDYLFPSRQVKYKMHVKRELDRSTVYKMWNRVMKKYGLTSVGCHTTRKTFGYHMYLQNKNNIGLLMDIFGHSDPSITLRYIGITQDAINKALFNLKYR